MKDFASRNSVVAFMSKAAPGALMVKVARRIGAWRFAASGRAAAVVAGLMMAFAFAGCAVPVDTGGTSASPMPAQERQEGQSSAPAARSEEGDEIMDGGSEAVEIIQPEESLAIPSDYREPCERAGHLERLDYDTFEAFSYADRSESLSKYAIVYVPYGYDEGEKYNVVYLMHGGWSDQTTFLGTPGAPGSFKNVIDHAMADGVIEPCLIVCPTYNNTSTDDAADYALALELTARYSNELVNDLMPAVASAYFTYAAGGTSEALVASRDHRAFMGFSMGSVTTWHIFENCLAYFRFFAPASGNAGSGAYWADAVERQGFGAEDFLIVGATGSNDFNGSAFSALMQDMAANPMFRAGEGDPDANLVFYIGSGESHDGYAAGRYMYNAMAFLWHESAV